MNARTRCELVPLDAMEEAAACLRTIAHPARLRMIEILLDGEQTVGALAEACELAPHVASEHLRVLRDRGLVAAERRGRQVFCTVAEEGLAGIIDCVRKRFGKK